jgi:MYND finger
MTGGAHCARCGTGIPAPTGRAARRRYCGDSCRKAAWRDRHRDDAPADIVAEIVPDVVPGTVVPTPVPGRSRNTGQPAPLPTLPPTPGDHQRRHPCRRRRRSPSGAAHDTQLTR